MILGLILIAILLSIASAADQRKISTWAHPGGGGPMGKDLTEALAWVKVRHGHFILRCWQTIQ